MNSEEFQAKFGMSIHERAQQLMIQEIVENPVPIWWYLSFARPHGFAGGCIVLGHGFVGATFTARFLGIHPQGDVETMGVPVPLDKIPPESYRQRLLTKAELSEFWGDMKSLSEIEEEERRDAN